VNFYTEIYGVCEADTQQSVNCAMTHQGKGCFILVPGAAWEPV